MSATLHRMPCRSYKLTEMIASLMQVNGVARAAQTCARIGIPLATVQQGLDVYYRRRSHA